MEIAIISNSERFTPAFQVFILILSQEELFAKTMVLFSLLYESWLECVWVNGSHYVFLNMISHLIDLQLFDIELDS